MLDSILPSKANPDHRAQRKAIEKEHNFEDLKSMGLKAGVLAVMAGLALYPKISAEADVVEREMRMKNERRDVFKRREREDGGGRSGGVKRGDDRRSERDERDYRNSGRRDGGRDGGRAGVREIGFRERDSGRDDRRDSRAVMRVDEYDMRRGQGYRRSEPVQDRRRLESGIRDRERDRRMEEGSVRSGGSSRTQEWVEGGYEYLNANDYKERDRRRW